MLFRDVLRLLRSGMVCTFLLEGECRDVAGGVGSDYETGIMLSAKGRREVLDWIRGGTTTLPTRSDRGDIQKVTGRRYPPRN